MKKVYSLVKFWVLIKIAHIRLRRLGTLKSVSDEQEKLKIFLLGIIDRISDFLITSHSAKLNKMCRKFSDDLIDLSVGLRETYAFPVWDNILFYACDLRTLTHPADRIKGLLLGGRSFLFQSFFY